MKLFFDSSVLIPVFYADHPQHAASTRAFRSARKEEAFCALQTLGEVSVVSLIEAEYLGAIEAFSETIVGGAVYDVLIARGALKAGADVLLTWNQRDFTRFGNAIAHLVKTPADLGSVT